MNGELTRRVTQALAERSRQNYPSFDATPAAVLVPVFRKAGEWHLLLTKRSSTVRRHKGEIAFPGGRRDPEDADLVDTALRETEEEIGLRRGHVQILGELDAFPTGTGYYVTPFVGLIPHPYEFQISAVEIDRLIEVPLPVIARPEAFEQRAHPNRSRPWYFYHYGPSDPIWGASGFIVHQFLAVVYPLLATNDDRREF